MMDYEVRKSGSRWHLYLVTDTWPHERLVLKLDTKRAATALAKIARAREVTKPELDTVLRDLAASARRSGIREDQKWARETFIVVASNLALRQPPWWTADYWPSTSRNPKGPAAPQWDSRFDPKTVRAINALAPKIYREIERATNVRVDKWPPKIEAMTKAEIADGSVEGAGHGLYFPGSKRVKLNASMPTWQLLSNFVHEHCHHACPELAEHEIDLLTEQVTSRVDHDVRLNPEQARRWANPPADDRARRIASRLAHGGAPGRAS